VDRLEYRPRLHLIAERGTVWRMPRCAPGCTCGRHRRGAERPGYKGQDAGYKSRHKRVYRARGSAKSHACDECGNPARDWARIHERDGLDPYDYRPLCRSCHIRYDWDDRYSPELQERRADAARRGWAGLDPVQRQQRLQGMRDAPMSEERRQRLAERARKLRAEGSWQPSSEQRWTDEHRKVQSERIRNLNAAGRTGWAVVNRMRAKLTEDDVRAIRRRAAAGESRTSLAAAYGVSYMAITDVVKRRSWADVE
jgi:hypothetical protein